jgi:hypothetical protein
MVLVNSEGDEIFEFEKHSSDDEKKEPLSWMTEEEQKYVKKDISHVFQIRFKEAEDIIKDLSRNIA